MVGSEDGKMKRAEIERYVAPALRNKFNKHFEEKMEYAKENFTSEAANRQTYSSEYRDSSRRTTNIVLGKVRYNSSGSSNPRNTSDESDQDYDSSDFEECCSVPTEAMSDEETSMRTNEKTSDDHWNKRRGKPTKNNHDIKAENYQTSTKIPNRILMEDDSNLESLANQLLHFKSNETKSDKRVFYNSDESSISDIEALIDDHMKIEGRVLTSTPYSDIDEQKVIDAAKFDPKEDDGVESTLLCQSETTINTNRNKCDYNFEIYQDPSSVTNHSTDFTKIFGNDYIPPPIPRPAFAFRLPLIHRLPLRISPPTMLSAPGQVSSQERQQSPALLGNPRSVYPPSLQLYSSGPLPSSFISTNSSRKSTVTRYVLSLDPSRASNPLYRPSLPPIPSPQERINPPRPLQNASNSPHFDQRGLNVQGLESNEQEAPFYIPPPVPPLQHMNRVQQIRNLNQRLNVQSRQLSSISSLQKSHT